MSFLLGLLLVLAPCLSAAEVPQVVFAQIGNSITIPRKLWGEKDKIHVIWYFNDILLITRNPTSSSPKTVPQNWQGRLSLSSDLSLIISYVNASDFGIFKCEQHELMHTVKDTYKLYQVTMSTLPPLLTGGHLSLFCEIEHEGFALVRPTITWIGPDKRNYRGASNKNKHTLSVTNISSIHSGKWTCEVKHGARGTLDAKTDVVIVDLAPSPPDPIYTHDSSFDFSIPCSLASKIHWSTVKATGVTGGSWSFSPPYHSESTVPLLRLHPNPTPTWKVLNGTHSSLSDTELKNHELNLKISKVSIKDRGTYTCRLEFGPKTLSRKVQVEVLQVISSAGNVIYEGNKLNLTCTLGHPMPSDLEVNWIPPSGSSLPKLNSPHPSELSIPRVILKDRGRWTCQLKKNATLLTSATISLKIEKARVDIWLGLAITGGVLVFILLSVITVIIIRKRSQVMRYRRRKKRFCCCKNPQPKGFYKT